MSSYPVPNVGTMTSTGLTDAQVSAIFQQLVLQCLGITPSGPTDPIAYARVRIDWPVPGQPGFIIADDVAFIRATESAEPYNFAHEVQQDAAVVSQQYGEQTIYTRCWDIGLIFYGPSSFDHARQVKGCLYQDFVHDTLAASNLYVVPTIGTPRRVPELFANQWWPRTDFAFRMYEQVTDSLNKQPIDSVEIVIKDAYGNGSDFVVS